MRRALAAGALMLLAAGAPPPADQAVIAGGPVELARQASIIACGTLDAQGRLTVARYWKGSGPPVLALPGSGHAAGQQVAAFLEQVPGRPGVLRPLPLGANGETGVIAMTGDRLSPDGQRLADVIAAASHSPHWSDRLRGGADDPAIRQ